ncbi:hypothetical protein ScPMuIL_004748 [Solemya velum]
MATCDSTFERQLPEDVVEYFLYPVIPKDVKDVSNYLDECTDLYFAELSQFLLHFIWQNEPLNLSAVLGKKNEVPPHLYGQTNFGDCIDDEWFIIFLLFHLTKQFPGLIARVNDNDGEVMLIELGNVLPKWVTPESAKNRVCIYGGKLHLVPFPQSPAEITSLPMFTPTLLETISCTRESSILTIADKKLQEVLGDRMSCFPKRIEEDIHFANCYIPASLAAILSQKPSLISSGVRAFYYRDPIDLKCCRTMQYFRPGTRVMSRVRFTKILYAQLLQQRFQPDRRSGYTLPSQSNSQFKAHDLGAKLAHGFEILCAKCSARPPGSSGGQGVSPRPSDVRWNRFLKSLQDKGFFKGEIEGSELYKKLLEDAKNFYMDGVQSVSNDSSEPGQEILALLNTVKFDIEELRRDGQKLPPSDDDSWMEISPEALDELLQKKSGLVVNGKDKGVTSQSNTPDLGKLADSMKSFVDKVSSVEGAEFPKDNGAEDDDEVQFDTTGVIASMQKMFDFTEDKTDSDSSDMSEYDWEDSDEETSAPHNKKTHKPDRSNLTLDDYMGMMDRELAQTNIGKSFVKADEAHGKAKKTSANKDIEEEDDEFQPVNIDVNLVKNMLESYGAQQGLPGPASNILNSMGIALPRDQPLEGPEEMDDDEDLM